MDWSAHNTANINTEDARATRVTARELQNRAGVETMSVRTEAHPEMVIETVEQMESHHQLKANVAVERTQHEMTGEVIDLFA